MPHPADSIVSRRWMTAHSLRVLGLLLNAAGLAFALALTVGLCLVLGVDLPLSLGAGLVEHLVWLASLLALDHFQFRRAPASGSRKGTLAALAKAHGLIACFTALAGATASTAPVPAPFLVLFPLTSFCVLYLAHAPLAAWTSLPDQRRREALLGAKRLGDVVVAGLALVALHPLLAIAALAGLERSERLGLGGRRIQVLRSRAGTAYDLPLRLVLVLRGDLSLVGPPALDAGQAQLAGWHPRRLSLRPGLVGARSGADQLLLDLDYVDHWNPVLDLTLLLRPCLTTFLQLADRAPLSGFFLAFAVLVHAPLMVAWNNPGTVPCSRLEELALFAVSFGVLGLSFFLQLAVPVAARLEPVLGAMALYVLLATNVLPLSTGLLDGRTVSQSFRQLLPNLGLALAAAVCAFRFRQPCRQLLLIVGGVSLLLSGYVLVHLPPRKPTPPTEELPKLGRRNVLLVVMDMFQGEMVEQVLVREPQLARAFEGFTFFQNAVSSAPYTLASTSVLLSGALPSPGAQRFTVPADDNLLRDAGRLGYELREVGVQDFEVAGVAYWPSGTDLSTRFHAQKLVPLAALRYLPARLLDSPNPREFGWMSKRDARDAFTWFIEHLSHDPEREKVFLHYHCLMTHQPIRFTREGVFRMDREPNDALEELEYGLRLLARLTERLKALDLYDTTDLMVVGDHGYNIIPSFNQATLPPEAANLRTPFGSEHLLGQYDVTVMAKPRSSRGPLRFSRSATALLDVRRSLNELMAPGSGEALGGRNLLVPGPVRRRVPALRFVGNSFDRRGELGFWTPDELQLPLDRPATSLDD